MSWFDTSDSFILYTAVGLIVLGFGLLDKILREYLFLTEIGVAVITGIFIGNFFDVYTLVDSSKWLTDADEIEMLAHAARFTLAIQLMTTALQSPDFYYIKNWKALAVLLIPVMTITFAVSGLIAWGILGMGVNIGFLVGGFVAPTDPVIAASIVSGPFSERRLRTGFRDVLTAESGANDGLGFPFVYLSVSVLANATAGEAMKEWFLVIWLYDVVVGVMLGFVMGYVAGILLLISEWYNLIDKNNYFTFSTGLTFLVLGVSRLLNMDEVFCVFSAGIAFGDVVREEQRHHELRVQEMLNFVVTLAFFLIFGLRIPWDEWAELSWRGPVLCIVLMLVKRIPFVMMFSGLLKPHVGNWKEALFLGWFGPVGVACIYYAAIANERLKEHMDFGPIWGIATQLVVCSIIMHGFTAVPFTYILWMVNKGVRKELEAAMQEKEKRRQQVVYPYDDTKNYISDWLSAVLGRVDELRKPHVLEEEEEEEEEETPPRSRRRSRSRSLAREKSKKEGKEEERGKRKGKSKERRHHKTKRKLNQREEKRALEVSAGLSYGGDDEQDGEEEGEVVDRELEDLERKRRKERERMRRREIAKRKKERQRQEERTSLPKDPVELERPLDELNVSSSTSIEEEDEGGEEVKRRIRREAEEGRSNEELLPAGIAGVGDAGEAPSSIEDSEEGSTVDTPPVGTRKEDEEEI